MKKFDENYILVKAMVNDGYYPPFLVEKIKKLIIPIIGLLENGETDISVIQGKLDEIMTSKEENIILVSHGDLLSVFYTMFLGLDIETINTSEIFGLAGGVSYMFENDEGKRFIKRISDMSYIN